MVVRKLHRRVTAFRQYLRERAVSPADQELLDAKVVGRWPSGAPLILAPERDDPALGADPQRNNAFMYADDPRGLTCPFGAHARRMNPRDSVVVGEVRLHRMIRRGASYGPPLPAGVLEDDGADRGLMFAFVGAHLARQFEFVQTQWSTAISRPASPACMRPAMCWDLDFRRWRWSTVEWPPATPSASIFSTWSTRFRSRRCMGCPRWPASA
jgi:deferrochelatase/peroxidase EfeB